MMMSKPRFVLDTNLIVSATLMERSVSRQAFEQALSQGDILVSDDTQDELTEVMMRSKFDRYLAEDQRLRFLANFLSISTPVKVTTHIEVCRDPKDNKFLELSVSGNTECIVTGDKDLLILHPFRGISILSPSDFLKQRN